MYATLGLLQAVGIGFAAIVVVVAIFVVAVLVSAIKIVKEYERGVIFRLGRVQGGPKGPGLFLLYPLEHQSSNRTQRRNDSTPRRRNGENQASVMLSRTEYPRNRYYSTGALVDRMVKIDLRTVTMDVPPQDVITRDNVPARVNAVVYFRVVDPNRSVLEVENHVLATSQISQTTLRDPLQAVATCYRLTSGEIWHQGLCVAI